MTIRYGVIGIQGIGKTHIECALQNPRLDLTALCDVNGDALRAKASDLKVLAFEDYREMLSSGCVDAVSIATPHGTHASIGLECLAAGLHIFVEKPLCKTVSEADLLLSAAKLKQLKICVGHQYRLNRVPSLLKKRIDAGDLGDVLHVNWTFMEYRPNRYFSSPDWRATWADGGGGVLPNQASHELDVVCWLIGKAREVCAIAETQIHDVEVEDCVAASVKFENGALGSFFFTLNQPRAGNLHQISGDKGILMIQNGSSLVNDMQDKFLMGRYNRPLKEQVSDSQAPRLLQPSVHWDETKLPPLNQRWKRPARLWKRFGLWTFPVSAHSRLMESFVDAILTDTQPLVSGESVLPVIELMNGMIVSSVRKRTVQIPLDRQEVEDVFLGLSSGKASLFRSA